MVAGGDRKKSREEQREKHHHKLTMIVRVFTLTLCNTALIQGRSTQAARCAPPNEGIRQNTQEMGSECVLRKL